MFGVPGLQGGLLRQGEGFHRRGCPPLRGLKHCRQLGASGGDTRPPRRPHPRQALIHPHDFPDRPLGEVGAGPFGEGHPQPGDEVGFQAGVVPLRRGHRRLMDHPTIQGQPPQDAIGAPGLHLVGDGDVGVQIRVADPGVAVGEHRPDQPFGVHLPHPVRTHPGVGGVRFQPPDDVPDRCVVGCLNLRRHLPGGHRPQRGHTFHRRKRQVIPSDRGGGVPGAAGDEPRQLPLISRGPRVLLMKQCGANLGPDPSPQVLGDHRVALTAGGHVVRHEPLRHHRAELGGPGKHFERHPEPGRRQRGGGAFSLGDQRLGDGIGVRVPSLPEQGLHLRLGHHTARRNATQPVQAGTHPLPGGFPLLGVVLPQTRRPSFGGIDCRDLAGQVRIPVPRCQLMQRHHQHSVTPTNLYLM